MFSEKTISQLRVHAGLETTQDGTDASIALCSWPRGSVSGNLQLAFLDLLRTLDILNREANGEVPSSTDSLHVPHLPRSVVYAITEIVRLMRECEEAATGEDIAWFNRARRAIEVAWSAILAGDIDDLQAHIREEESARA